MFLKMNVRMSAEEQHWWKSEVEMEKRKASIWNRLMEEEYANAETSFNISLLKFKETAPDIVQPKSEKLRRKEDQFLHLLTKKMRVKPFKTFKDGFFFELHD